MTKSYLTQFNTSKAAGRKELKALKSRLSYAGIFYSEEPGNTHSHRAVYVDGDLLREAQSVLGVALSSVRFDNLNK